jgi:hypothetical protein
MQRYWSKFESVWITLAYSTAAQSQALSTVCAAGAVCNTHTMAYIGFQDDSRGRRHCVGFG